MENNLVPTNNELVLILLKQRKQMWLMGLDLKWSHHGSTKEDQTRECSNCRTPGYCTPWLIGQALTLASRLSAEQIYRINLNEPPTCPPKL